MLLVLFCRLHLSAAELDPSKLPPPATNQIDFARDIKPILDETCLRCHGPEKPKSGFRLDNRAAALKGGENGVDIRPGDSAHSPLAHYVAALVPDMEMPPVGKGRQLTPAEVGRLRAWIDQGAAWDTATPTNVLALEIDPTFADIKVHGDKHKFQEQYWEKAGPNGGVENFDLFEQPNADTKVSVTGHESLDDYKVVLSLDRNELGFVHSGWEQYRKWYDDTGGFLPTATSTQVPQSGRDLHLDIGKAWVDVGLALPNWPLMVLGYELDYKRGNEATASWGAFGTGANSRNSAPASEAIHEGVHIIKFDLDDEIKGILLEERFRAEFYRLETQGTNQASRSSVSDSTHENNHYFQGANTIRLEKQVTSWLFCSAGYLFSKLEAGANFTDSVNLGNTLFFSQVPQIIIDKESDVVNLNALVVPFDGLSLSAGGQGEWDRQHGLGSGTLNQIAFTMSPATLGVNPATVSSDYDENSVSETLGLRYTKIPFTVLFAEARAKQDRLGQNQSDVQPSGSFLQDPTYTSQSEDMRAGFNTSPWRAVSLSAHYRRFEEDDRYQTNDLRLPAGGYPGFLRERYTLTDEAEAKLVLHPCNWLKTSLTYQYLITDYRDDDNPAATLLPPAQVAPGGDLLAGRYRSQVGSANVTLTPSARLLLSGTFTWQPTSVSTASSASPAIAPYRGRIFSVQAGGTYLLNPSTDVFASYSFSEADYAQNNFAAGLPVGLEYQQHAAQVGISHRFTKNFSAKFQYGTYYYSEPSSGRADNFVAHAIFGTIAFRLH